MPTTRETMHGLVVQELGGGEWLGLATSVAGLAGGTTVVDASLGGVGDDRFERWWARCRSGTNDGEHREVSDFVSVGGTVTVREAFTAQVANGVTFDLTQYNPGLVYTALDEAMKECYGEGRLFIGRRDESIVVDNLLLNADFETFAAGNFTNWTLAGAGSSVAQSTSLFWHGADCAAVTAGAGAAATYAQAINASPAFANIRDPGSKSFVFRAWVYATAATIARLQLTDGTDTASGSYHTGNDGWELLDVTLTPGGNIGTVTAQLQVAAGGTGRIDAASVHVAGHYVLRYALPSTIWDVGAVSVQLYRNRRDSPYKRIDGWDITEDANVRSLLLPSGLTAGYRVRMEGRVRLTAFSTAQTAAGEATETEVDAPRSRLLVLKAAEIVLRWEAMAAPLGMRQGSVERAVQMRELYQAEAGGANRMVPVVDSPMKRW